MSISQPVAQRIITMGVSSYRPSMLSGASVDQHP
jgi:hypothetical protein